MEAGAHQLRRFIHRDDFLDDVFRLDSICLPELLPGSESSGIPGVWTITAERLGLAGHGVGVKQQIVPAGEGQLNGLDQVEVVIDRAGAVVAGHRILQAANRGIIVHVGRVDQVLHAGHFGLQKETGHRALIEIEQEGRALAGGDHIDHLVQQGIRAVTVQAHVGLRLKDRRHFIDHLEHYIGQFIGQISPARAYA